MKETITVTYTVKNDNRDIAKLAESIAIGQSTGTWHEIPHDIRLKISKHLAEVVSIEQFQFTSNITISFPIENFKDDIGALLTAIFGKISLMPKIKLDDIKFSNSYLKLFPGPKLGINKIREKLDKPTGCLFMSIFKPCLGLSPSEISDMFLLQAEGGMDLVKDDEILYDDDFSFTLKRLSACLKVKEKSKAKTIYAINLTGQASDILNRAKELEKNGAECILFNYVSYGFPLLKSLSEAVSIPIMAHPAFSGSMCMGSSSGISENLVLGKLPRLCGADFVLFPSPYGSLAWDKETTKKIKNDLTCKMNHIKPIWAVPSAGIKANMIENIISDFGEDIIINAGTAVWEHKDGGKAGAYEFTKK